MAEIINAIRELFFKKTVFEEVSEEHEVVNGMADPVSKFHNLVRRSVFSGIISLEPEPTEAEMNTFVSGFKREQILAQNPDRITKRIQEAIIQHKELKPAGFGSEKLLEAIKAGLVETVEKIVADQSKTQK